MRGFKNIKQITENLGILDSVCQRNGGLGKTIGNQLDNLKGAITLETHQIGTRNGSQRVTNLQYKEDLSAINNEEGTQHSTGVKDTLVIVKYKGSFNHQLKSIIVIVSKGTELYTIRTLKQ
jgi:hypothetical protein